MKNGMMETDLILSSSACRTIAALEVCNLSSQQAQFLFELLRLSKKTETSSIKAIALAIGVESIATAVWMAEQLKKSGLISIKKRAKQAGTQDHAIIYAKISLTDEGRSKLEKLSTISES